MKGIGMCAVLYKGGLEWVGFCMKREVNGKATV